MFQIKTIKRMDERVNEIIRDYPVYVKVFNESGKFSGPSEYFHTETIRMTEYSSLSELLSNEKYIQFIYATLISWGMHRMGDEGAKMPGYSDFKDSIISQQSEITELENLRIENLDETQISRVSASLWKILDNINASTTNSKLVSSSKALYHLLPNLSPPIDRRYTCKVLLESSSIENREDEVFNLFFPRFVKIAKQIENPKQLIDESKFCRNLPKLVDNVLIGYGIRELGL